MAGVSQAGEKQRASLVLLKDAGVHTAVPLKQHDRLPVGRKLVPRTVSSVLPVTLPLAGSTSVSVAGAKNVNATVDTAGDARSARILP